MDEAINQHKRLAMGKPIMSGVSGSSGNADDRAGITAKPGSKHETEKQIVGRRSMGFREFKKSQASRA